MPLSGHRGDRPVASSMHAARGTVQQAVPAINAVCKISWRYTSNAGSRLQKNKMAAVLLAFSDAFDWRSKERVRKIELQWYQRSEIPVGVIRQLCEARDGAMAKSGYLGRYAIMESKNSLGDCICTFYTSLDYERKRHICCKDVLLLMGLPGPESGRKVFDVWSNNVSLLFSE